MNAMLVVAQNTYREILRDRILYGLIVFAVMLILLSLALGTLSFTEQARITVDFGFTAIHLSAVILAIFVGSTLVGREIEKKTIMTLLVRPISRTQFIIGKSLGLMGVILVSILFFALVLVGILFAVNQPLNWTFIIGLYGVILEAILLLSVTLFFGCFASPMLSVSFSIGIFLIGHWLDSLIYFTSRSESVWFSNFGKVVSQIIPNLEYFNWRALFVYNTTLAVGQIGWVSLYALAWSAFLIALATTILSNRDLG